MQITTGRDLPAGPLHYKTLHRLDGIFTARRTGLGYYIRLQMIALFEVVLWGGQALLLGWGLLLVLACVVVFREGAAPSKQPDAERVATSFGTAVRQARAR
jgi:hypothetical protein